MFSEQQVMKSGWWSKKFWHRNTHKCIEHCTTFLPITPRSKNNSSADFAACCSQPSSPAAVLPIPHKHGLSIAVFKMKRNFVSIFCSFEGKGKFIVSIILLSILSCFSLANLRSSLFDIIILLEILQVQI